MSPRHPPGPGLLAVLAALASLLILPTEARSMDGPHNAAGGLLNACQDCHIGHDAPGLALTRWAGNANLCLTCHATKPNVSGWQSSDQADSSGTRSSHSWGALAVNPAAGAGLPANEEVLQRLDGYTSNNPNKRLTCSACHDQHAQTFAPADPIAPATAGAAGRHFQRIDNRQDQLCVTCHSSRNLSSVRTYTGSNLSHPVGVTIGAPKDLTAWGAATGGSTTTLDHAGQTWVAGALVDHWVSMTSGGNSGVTRKITGNTPTQLQFAQFPVAVANGATYVVTGTPQVAGVWGSAASGTATSLTVSGAPWTAGALVGQWVRFTSNANKNTTKKISANGTNSLSWVGAITAITAGTTFEVDADGNLSNNVLLDSAGAPSFTTGATRCLSCHGVHYTDSNATTYDDQPRQGDGKLLRRTNDDGACMGCHTTAMHNSVNTGSIKYTYGLSFACRTCHAPHGTRNIFLVKESITTPNSGVRTVDFRNYEGWYAQGLANSAAPGTGPCEVCHTLPGWYTNNGVGANGHYTGKCTGCHPHNKGFQPQDTESQGDNGCSGCHDYRMVVGETGVAATYHHVMEADTVIVTNQSQYPTSATPTAAVEAFPNQDKTCLQCHVDHDIFRPSVNLNSPGRSYNLRTAVTATPTANTPAAGNYTNTDASGAGGICLSCHTSAQAKNNTAQLSDGNATTPALSGANFAASPHSYSVTGKLTKDASTFTIPCTKCHSSDPTSNNDFGDGYGANLPDKYQGAASAPTPPVLVTTDQLYFKPNAETRYANELVEPMPNAHMTGDVFQAGTWIGRSMSPTAPTAADETKSQATASKKPGNYRMVTFVSPPVSAAVNIPAGAWTLSLWDSVSAATTSYVRYYVYVWRANDTLGTAAAAAATHGTVIPTVAAFQTITINGAALSLAAGDKIAIDLEFNFTASTTTLYTINYVFGTSHASYLRLPSSVEWELAPELPAPPDTSPKFVLHTSSNRRLLAPLGMTAPGDPPGESFCYRCHSLTSDTTPGGGPAKGQAGKDWYSSATTTYGPMTTQSERIFTTFNYAFTHPVNEASATSRHDLDEGTTTGWNPSGTRHVQCEDCHSPHSPLPVGPWTGTVGSYAANADPAPDVITVGGTSPAWATNVWRGYSVRVMSGAQVGKSSTIWANGANTLSVQFGTAPAAGDKLQIFALATTTGNVSPVHAEVWGVKPTTWPTKAAANWNDSAGTATADDLTTQYNPVSGWTRTDPNANQGEVCVKCHSAYTGALPNTPSGAPAGGTMAQSDLVSQFNPNNLGHHAIFARGENQPIRANYGQAGITSVENPGWKRYFTALAGDTVAIANGTASFAGAAALPATALPGWYLYVDGANDGVTAGTAPITDALAGGATAGYLEITAIASPTSFTVRAENGAGGWVTNVTRASTQFWHVTAGLGDTFVPPFGPWSTLKCSDCHTSDSLSDPFGPHGSGSKWQLAAAKAQSFLWYDGTGVVTVTTTPNGAPAVFCQNCHRQDVYGDQNVVLPAQATLSRQQHPVDRAGADGHKYTTNWGIACLNCHGGARTGQIHGSNLGKGFAGAGGSYSGKRLLAGSSWYALTRGSTATAGKCWTKGGTDSVDNCGHSHSNTPFGTGVAKYNYENADP